MYELPIAALRLELGAGVSVDVSNILSSGRTNYQLFQHLVAWCTGMQPGGEGAGGDLRTGDGRSVEVKAFYDLQAYPSLADRYELVHTAASSTFGPNNHGPHIKAALADGNYAAALQVCWDTGYATNDLYAYTNTRGFRPGTPLRYVLVPTEAVLANLSRRDPRIVHRGALADLVTGTHVIDPTALPTGGVRR